MSNAPTCERHKLELERIYHKDSPDNGLAWQCPYSKMIWWDSEIMDGKGIA